ncbi:N-acetylmuramoyl-L-alanine amidase [Geodermatophilus sp. URMC 62]|uniref:N-acetylmuramoyl-L-alanine amidase n=1 Tax=Geodermatophilus sp. URMC 62 TaxID=3423414 RepID=UPI00406CC14D
MRRLITGSTAFVAFTGTFLVLPVYAEPAPEPVPVEVTAEEVTLGSVDAPAPEADVQQGTTDPVAGVGATAPTLTVRQTDLDEFSMVSVNWAYDPAVTDTVVNVRVQDEDGDWGEWTETGTEDATPDPGSDRSGWRGGTSPLWTGPSRGVEAELVTRSGAQPTDVQLSLVDPGESEADSGPQVPEITDTAEAALAMPPVYSRAQWGADEDLMTWAPQYASTIKAATLHHTASGNGYSADEVPAILRGIYYTHAVTNDWGDIGYNVLVDRFGRLWEGRKGGLASTVVGAHAGGWNTGTFGVSMIGNYDVVDTPQAMVDSVAAVIAWKFSLYGVNPTGTTQLTGGGSGTSRYPAGTTITLPTVFGHRDVGNTACPGRYGYSRLPEIRTKVAAALTATTPQITERYDSDPALRALLGAKTGPEQQSAGVIWQTYQGGNLYYTPDTGVKLVRGGILGGYLRAGGPASLGAPTVEERGVGDGRGAVAEFQRGAVYWTASTDAHVVRGAIRAYWLSTGGPTGSLGYQVEDERGAADGSGAWSAFERGTVYWSAASGPVVAGGGIRAVYEGSGGPTGPLGYPTAAEDDVSGGRGRMQAFQRGALYWTPAAYGALVYGAIRSAWGATDGPDGPLGLPTGSERAAADGFGRVQTFQGGSVYWSPASGAHPVRGGVLATWLGSGGETGPTGYPTSAEAAAGDGRGQVQRFQSGSIYWTATTGAHIVRGAVGAIWLASGGPGGPLGYPAGGERDTADGRGRVQSFERGEVYWSATTGARIVRGDIADAYAAAGGVTGVLGLPTAEATATGPGGTGRVQTFQGGGIWWTADHGAHVVRGGIGATWAASGGVTGRLGFPVGDETATAAGAQQRFQGGTVTWTTATGRATVSYA